LFNRDINYSIIEVGNEDLDNNQNIVRIFIVNLQLYLFIFRKM